MARPRKKAAETHPPPDKVVVYIEATRAEVALTGDTAEVPITGQLHFAGIQAGVKFGVVPYYLPGEKPPPPTLPVNATIPREVIAALCKAPGLPHSYDVPAAAGSEGGSEEGGTE